MGNTEKNKSKKYRRKIRIKLKDPNIPDSYVCEIFDSSLENEEDESKGNGLEDHEDPSKPKNYFELLMSKECRKNHVNTSVKLLNHSIKVVDGEEIDERGKKTNADVRKSLPVSGGTAEWKYETDSSDDESLLQIQKNKLQRVDKNKESDGEYVAKEAKQEFTSGSDVNVVFESPKVPLGQKKALSILSYFSKTETNHKDSMKTSQASNCLKLVKNQNSEKPGQNGKKILLNSINKENVKLAPLFYKKAPKVIDTAAQKARLDFLYKETSVIKKSERKICENVLIFPKIPHVQQRNDSACWSRREIRLPLPEVQYSDEYAFSNNKTFTLQIEDSSIMSNSVTSFESTNDKDMLRKLKCKYLELKLDLVIDGLKEKRDRYLARAGKLEKLKNSVSQNASGDIGHEELSVLLTEKYKPKSNEILGNDDVVKKLKKWLEAWKLFDEELKNFVKSKSFKICKQSDEASDDDFLDSKSQNFCLKAPCNVCFISGPNGCGKTALVHALAGELEFTVLELNASSKRTGKKVLADIQEATQSHKVQRITFQQTDQLEKKNPKRKNKKVKKPSEVSVQPNDFKISLILIEDADLIYDEHDEGFFPAISSLVQTSKRPLIFLSNEPNCHFLYNFKTEQCLVLEMQPPNFASSCAVLDIVSALEGGNLDREDLECFVRQSNFDLRKSLLQLQFWMHARKTSAEKRFDLGHLWWGSFRFLFKQDIRHFVKNNARKRKRVNDLFDSSDEELETAAKKHKSDSADAKTSPSPSTCEVPEKRNVSMEPYFKVLDLLSSLDGFGLTGSQEPTPGTQYKPKDSLSLEENMEEASRFGKSMAEKISVELINLTGRKFLREVKEKNVEDRKLDFVSPCWEEIRWRDSQEKATAELSLLVPPQRGRDKRSLHLDYLPFLRKICRVEKNPSTTNPKRRNRFYRHLNNLGPELTDKNLEINCDIFERPKPPFFSC